MDSESEQFQAAGQSSSFFSGFNKTPKLTEKERKLREDVYDGSAQQNKQTTLEDKISRRKKRVDRKDIQVQEEGREIFREKVTVEPKEVKKSQKSKFSHDLTKTFEDLRIIRPLLKAISDVSYTTPTPIQQLVIPVIMSGRDVVASSITGSGKTAAFVLPILQRYYNAAPVGYIRALIVTPTRELAVQIFEQFSKLNKYTRLQGALVIGASSIQKQQSALRNNPQLVVGTPGRIIDVLMNSRSVGMENLEMVVFDEADKLLELGFEAQIKQIMTMVNQQVQTVLFSATMGQEVNKLTATTTRKPIRISADPDHKTAQRLHQQVFKLKDQSDEYREAVLLSVLLNVHKQKTIVFFKTKKQCHRMTMVLGLFGVQACQLHGNLSQTQRLQAFLQFKQGKFQYMMATDLAARGLDIKEVKTVINYELPPQLTRYIHRIGRTARAGNVGSSLTLCNQNECMELKKMSRKTGDKLFKLTIDQKLIQESMRRIRCVEHDINQILEEERDERECRKADMELKKLQNINEHQSEIYSRPKKQWFMSEKEKKNIQDKAKTELGIPLEEKHERSFDQRVRGGKFQNKKKEGNQGRGKGKGKDQKNKSSNNGKRKFIKKQR